MSDPIIGAVLTQLGTILEKQIRQELRLVVGVDKDIENLKSTFTAIRAVLLDAEMSRVRKEPEKEGLELWLQDLLHVSYDMDDILADWTNAIVKREEELANADTRKRKVLLTMALPCFSFSRVVLRRDIALKIKEINERLEGIAVKKDRYNLQKITVPETSRRTKAVSHINTSEVCGREGDKNALVRALLNENSSRADRGLHLISVVGMGGIGKTTLAQLAYNSPEVKNYFDKRIWVCVSDSFDAAKIGKAIIEDAEGNAPNLFELNSIMSHLRKSIARKRFLIVLDDVWNEDPMKWDPLRICLTNDVSSSKILVTTRKEGVAKIMGSSYTLPLGLLSEQDCWSLFSQIAFFEKKKEEREEFKIIGKRIAQKCKGLPLAAKTIGNLMRLKNSVQDWQSVLDSYIWVWELKEAKEGPFAALLLSYYDLPAATRKCFSYCAIFPKDCKIEAGNVIKMWMAQGYLNSQDNNNNNEMELESSGRNHLDDLIGRSFFQDLERDKDSGIVVRFKMHDMVHDFAQYLTKGECQMLEVDNNLEHRINTSSIDARHLTLIRSEDVSFPSSVGNLNKPHTFWVQSFHDCPALVSEEDIVSPELFSHLLRVKALDLSRNRLRELPEEIGKLINLRYLNLSHNPLSELPETVCGLYNLQTLKLVACDHLVRLPEGIGKLRNLRHLEIDRTDNLKSLPKGIGKLKSLQTLNKLILTSAKDTEEKLCKLGDIKDLNLIRGCLKIEGLGSVSNAAEARKAELKRKTFLTGMHMDFSPLSRFEGKSEVAEALELQTCLQSLQISFYGATQLPSWITTLNNLQKLQLQDCQNCNRLPALGRLPSLQTLYIENMHELKRIGNEFLGTDAASSSTATAAAAADPVTVFPKLKKLKFEHMRSLEEWELEKGVPGRVIIMPCLRYLKLSGCSKLKALPDSVLQKDPVLRKLRINKSPLLQQKYEKGSEVHWKISQIQKVRIS